MPHSLLKTARRGEGARDARSYQGERATVVAVGGFCWLPALPRSVNAVPGVGFHDVVIHDMQPCCRSMRIPLAIVWHKAKIMIVKEDGK